jgi:hypothetical protein
VGKPRNKFDIAMHAHHLPDVATVLLNWLNWPPRLQAAWLSCAADATISNDFSVGDIDKFVEFLQIAYPNCELLDLRTLCRSVLKANDGMTKGFAAWICGLVELSGILRADGLSAVGDRPGLSPLVWTFWRKQARMLSLDVLVTQVIAERHGWRHTASFNAWGDLPGVWSRPVEDCLRQGQADIHIHLMGSLSKHRAWLEYLFGYLPEKMALAPRFAAKRGTGSGSPIELMLAQSDSTQLDEDLQLLSYGWEAWRRLLQHFTEQEASVGGSDGEVLELLVHYEEIGTFNGRSTPAQVGAMYRLERLVMTWAWGQINDRAVTPPSSTPLPEPAIAALLDVYVGARQFYFRENLQYPGGSPGLKNFRGYLDRSRGHFNDWHYTPEQRAWVYLTGPVCNLLENRFLQAIEVRIAPMSNATEYARFFKAWIELPNRNDWFQLTLEQRQGYSAVRFVVHFIRREQMQILYSPDGDRSKFENEVVKLGREAAMFHMFRMKYPEYAQLVVGVDVTNFERSAPPSLFAPVIRWLRQPNELDVHRHQSMVRQRRAPAHLAELQMRKLTPEKSVSLPDLGLTYHVGEDNVHPVDGMRQMDDAIELLNLRAGDRIGHGLAAGWKLEIDATGQHLRHVPAVNLTVADALQTLSWIWDANEDSPEPIESERRKLDEARIELLTIAIGSAKVKSVDWRELHDWRLNFDTAPDELEDDAAIPSWKTDDRFYINLGPEQVQKFLGCAPQMVKAAQRALLKKIVDKQLYIEFCPSSNFGVMNLQTMTEHPVFEYHRHGAATRGTINSDDPGTFHTRADIEVALMYQAMLDSGMEHDSAANLLNTWVCNGELARFSRRAEAIASWS